MPVVNLSTADLFYETHGSGPLLLLIAGAGGSGAIFHPVTSHLKSDFTVITYDRRGHSQSHLTGEQDYAHRLERDADDVADLLNHISTSSPSTDPIFIFGTSSGGIVALTFLIRHPSIAQKVIVHEPPLFRALPDKTDSDAQLAHLHEVYDTYRTHGMSAAMRLFGGANMSPEDFGVLASFDPRTNPYYTGNMLYWFERELLVYPSIEMPWAELDKDDANARLVIGVSDTGSKNPAARAGVAIAQRLNPGAPGVVTFPGAHLGYVNCAEAFADLLKGTLLS